MKITRKSTFTGKTHTKDLPVTQEQLDSYYNGGLLLQDAFPYLSSSYREFIKSGITAEEWDAMFPPEEDEPISRDDCVASGQHLQSCDDDGFCNHCGEQE